MTSRASPNKTSNVERGSAARSHHALAPITTVQPVDASARARVSKTRMALGTSAPMPWCVAGSKMRKHPAPMSWSSRSCGMRRLVSISTARRASAGASSPARRRTSCAVTVSWFVMVISVLRSGLQHRGFGGVACAQLVVPTAVAVTDDLADPSVAYVAEPEPSCNLDLGTVHGFLVLQDEARRGRHDAHDARGGRSFGDRAELSCEGIGALHLQPPERRQEVE